MSRARIRIEIVIVLALSLGASAIYSIVSIINRATRGTPLAQQTATLNPPLSDRAVFDLIYQVLGIAFDLAPVALVIYLLWLPTRPHLARLGVGDRQFGHDSAQGLALALAIGIPGIALYLGAKALGFGVTVVPTALDNHWWTVPILLLSAVRAGVTEEIIVVGYLFARLRDLGWRPWPIILASAVLRGSYHVYQGYGAFVGNVAMGVLFGWLYVRFGRVLPLVIAHAIIDAAAFVGYPWAAATFPAMFGIPA